MQGQNLDILSKPCDMFRQSHVSKTCFCFVLNDNIIGWMRTKVILVFPSDETSFVKGAELF